jgi:uncharacterized protein YcbK (DUF882 family)
MEQILRKLNFRETGSAATLAIDPSSIPTLIPAKNLAIITEGDTDPYFKIQEISYPIKANGWNYKESFFKSYIAKLNDKPIPGSKDGHNFNWGKTPQNDLFLIGAKINEKGDGTGTILLKNYIPPVWASDNTAFINDAKLNLVHFSMVSYTRDEIVDGPDDVREYNVIESVRGERNDAVEFDAGAMDQKTNGKAGDSPEEIEENDTMLKKDEVLEALRNFKANGVINAPELAKTLGLEIVGEIHTKAIATLKKVNELTGTDDPVKAVETFLSEKKENAKAAIDNKLTEEFGAVDKKNLLRAHANTMSDAMAADTKMEDRVKSIKENSISIHLAAQAADFNSSQNRESGKSNRKENGEKPGRSSSRKL